MKSLLNEQIKSERVISKIGTFLNFVMKQKKCIDTNFKNLVVLIVCKSNAQVYKTSWDCARYYVRALQSTYTRNRGLAPPFRPILLALQSPTNNLAKFSVPILNLLTKNEYTFKDSFHFAKDICEQDLTISKGSLDVDSRFSNIPLDETVDICVNQLLENTDSVESFKKSGLKQLLCLATKKFYI